MSGVIFPPQINSAVHRISADSTDLIGHVNHCTHCLHQTLIPKLTHHCNLNQCN